jgi:hypothetical protein
LFLLGKLEEPPKHVPCPKYPTAFRRL